MGLFSGWRACLFVAPPSLGMLNVSRSEILKGAHPGSDWRREGNDSLVLLRAKVRQERELFSGSLRTNFGGLEIPPSLDVSRLGPRSTISMTGR